jgi:hypothetical protein
MLTSTGIVSFFVSQNDTEVRNGGLPAHVAARRRRTALLKRPASANTSTAPKLYTSMPQYSDDIHYIQIHTRIRYF